MQEQEERTRIELVVTMDADGGDFHNFNVFFRNQLGYEVVAFAATQIPNIENRAYPPELRQTVPEGNPHLH